MNERIDAPRALLAVARDLIGLRDRLERAEPLRRAEIARLLNGLSESAANIAAEDRAGEVPWARFAQWIVAARTLQATLREEPVANLDEILQSFGDLDQLTADLNAAVDKECYRSRLEEASGKLLGLSRQLEISPGMNRLVVDLLDWEEQAMSHLAQSLGVKTRDLAREGILDFLRRNDGFDAALKYVLAKNRELYKRLD